jgi:hypothetical protein
VHVHVSLTAGATGKGAASSSTAASPADHGLTTQQRRVRAAAGIFELSQAGFGGLLVDGFLGDEDDKQQQQQHAAGADKSGAEAASASSGESLEATRSLDNSTLLFVPALPQ